MDRVAVFVDAGYFCTGGATVVAGTRVRRADVTLHVANAIGLLKAKAESLTNLQLLRIYWYDGAISQNLTTEQQLIAAENDVKLRLGTVNGFGEQKGVDSRIVTDMAELSRLRAICDAVLVAGDEDIRLGVELAQQQGVRVHLLAIEDSGCSANLKRESDTFSCLTRQEMNVVMTVAASQRLHLDIQAPGAAVETSTRDSEDAPVVDYKRIIAEYTSTLSTAERAAFRDAVLANRDQIPSEHDRRLLGRARESLTRNLTPPEKKELRQAVKDILLA
ncbi:NYN domain-containing protein [Desulfolutivibrio sulfoxidireducens]|uniref:NYN domain-containing protein n=1 Tax=Desulfolutivibrio sulfoxidireducens TaxID=2773299 RepID=UPI00159D661A|nr:NYN domain-containing protein [Desulfolutivibrio sulfoxidireducens]QLA18901.1 NYN domain-containing protein [Desulfolutivibrio sulfoxidireducens]